MKENQAFIQHLMPFLKGAVYGQVICIWLQSLNAIGIAYCLSTLIDEWLIQKQAFAGLHIIIRWLGLALILRLFWRWGRDYFALRAASILKKTISEDLFKLDSVVFEV